MYLRTQRDSYVFVLVGLSNVLLQQSQKSTKEVKTNSCFVKSYFCISTKLAIGYEISVRSFSLLFLSAAFTRKGEVAFGGAHHAGQRARLRLPRGEVRIQRQAWPRPCPHHRWPLRPLPCSAPASPRRGYGSSGRHGPDDRVPTTGGPCDLSHARLRLPRGEPRIWPLIRQWAWPWRQPLLPRLRPLLRLPLSLSGDHRGLPLQRTPALPFLSSVRAARLHLRSAHERLAPPASASLAPYSSAPLGRRRAPSLRRT